MNPREAALWWMERYQVWVVPVPWMQKGPVLKGWPELRLNPDSDLNAYFNGERQNIAILLGEPENLCDVDIDALDARRAWEEYAIPSGLRWGHSSKPSSHWLYYSEEPVHTIAYKDPAAGEGEKACMIELRCLKKDGTIGYPVVAPPSRHISGEDIELESAGHPAKTPKAKLEKHVRLTAAATMLGRHSPDGKRHEIFLALAGAFRRAEWPLEDAQRFLRAVFRVIWEDPDLTSANREADSSYQRFDDGKDITGLRTLAGLIDEHVFRTLKQWLGLEAQEVWMHAQPAPEKPPRVLPTAFSLNSLRTLTIPGSEMLIDQLLVTPGLTLMVGASKSGKTILSVQMGMCLANHLHLFDYFTTAQANTLIVEWDDKQGKSSLKAFELKARASRGENQPFHGTVKEYDDEDSLLDFTLSDPEFVPWLKGLIKEYQARFVILDSYTALRGFHSGGKDIVKVEATELSQLNRLAIEMSCAILLIHHTSKSAATQERHSRSAGTFVMAAVPEAQIVVERFRELGEEDPARLVSIRGRHLRGMQMVLRFREESLDFDFIMDGPASEEFPRLRQLLRGGFRGKAFTAAEVTKEIGWAKTQVYALLSRLTASGLLRKDGTSWTWEPNWTKTLEQI